MSKRIAIGCRFKNKKQKSKAIRRLLSKHGDDIPPKDVKEAAESEKLKNWSLLCNPKNRSEVVSAARTEKALWYQWDLKNLVTHPDFRGHGLGTKVLAKSVKRAEDRGARVLTADITITNKESLAVAKKAGFKPSFKFCFQKGTKPAFVMHHVLYAPNKRGRCV